MLSRSATFCLCPCCCSVLDAAAASGHPQLRKLVVEDCLSMGQKVVRSTRIRLVNMDCALRHVVVYMCRLQCEQQADVREDL
jgi:hypothetical protein